MTRLASLFAMLALGLAFTACGGDKDPKPSQDSGADAADAEQPVEDGNVPDADAEVEETPGGYDSGFDRDKNLAELSVEDGKTLCQQAEDYANSKITEQQRALATCVVTTPFFEDVPACEMAFGECPNDVGPQFAAVDFGCDALDVMTGCPGPGTADVDDVEDCVDGFDAFWSFFATLTVCEDLVGMAPADITAGSAAARAKFEAGLARCDFVKAVCPGFTSPTLFVGP